MSNELKQAAPTLFPLIISNSTLSSWSNCQLKFYREYCQNYRKAGFNIDLSAGGQFAKGLETTRKMYYNDGLEAVEAIEAGYYSVVEGLHAEMKACNAATDVLKSPERMGLALKEYFRTFPLESEEVIPAKLEDGTYAIEHKMTVELPIKHPELGVPLIFKGKLDMFAKHMGRTYIVDEKTTKAITSNTADLLATSGQFIGYAWLARELGICVSGAKIRKIAIQVKANKVEEFEVPITDYQIDMWYKSMIFNVNCMVDSYKATMDGFGGTDFKDYFNPDFQHGCTSFFRPCQFQDGCKSKYGESFIESNFTQKCWDSETRTEVSLVEFRKLLGLGD
jgi:hypothetical protein